MAEGKKKQEMTMEALLERLTEMEQKLEQAEQNHSAVRAVQENTLSGGQKQAVLERNLQTAMAEARKKTTKLILPLLGSTEEDDTAVCGVNGVLWQIRRGEEVEVPECVAEVFRNADRQRMEARERRKGLQKKK